MSVLPNTNPSALSYKDSLLANQLLVQMNPGVVYQLSNKASIFNYFRRLIDQKTGGSTSLWTPSIVSASRGLDNIQVRVNTRSVSNAPIVITFDSLVDGARVNDRVYYGNAFERTGRVIEAVNGPGAYVKIVPNFDGSFTSADFPVGALIGIGGDISPNTVSQQKERRFLTPTLQENYWSTSREGYHVARYEKLSTRATTNGNQPSVFSKDGQWWTSFQMDMLERMEREMDWEMRFGWARPNTNEATGEYSRNGGVRWHVINRGGDYLKYTTPLNRDQVDAVLSNAVNKNIGADGNYMWFMGQGLWAILSSFSEDFIRYAGVLNTWAGEDVSGLNIPTYSIKGIAKTIAIVQDPRLNEKLDGGLGTYSTIPGYTNYTLGQLTGFLMCDTPVRTPNGGTTPQFKKYHFGASEYVMGVMRGLDQNEFNSMSPSAAASFLSDNSLMVSTLQDASQVGVITQYGIDGTGYGCAWFEPGA